MTDPNPGGSEAAANHYAKVDHGMGVAVYTSEEVFDAIYGSGRFGDLSRDTAHPFVDLMSGPKCLVAGAMKKRAKNDGLRLDVYCLDIAFGKMGEDKKKELEGQDYKLAVRDITTGTGYQSGSFKRATARFGVKNYDRGTQKGILEEVRRILVPEDGIFVLTDMIAPPTSYEWMQKERRRKSRHTVGEENAKHHIPTLDMWLEMIRESGLEPVGETKQTKSLVKTTQWVESKQMGNEGREDMDRFLLSAPPEARRDFNIREEGLEDKKVVRIDYPFVIIAARAA